MTLCECGCGQQTSIVKETCRPRGLIKGQPRRFVHGHNGRLRNPGYTVDTETGCWNWNGHIAENGYSGMIASPFGPREPHESAHRVYYVRAKGPIPDGLELDHLCRNRRCVNPDHLEAVTPAENVRRSPRTKLTAEIAAFIRSRAHRGNHGRLAAQFGVCRPLITMIALGKRWAT